MDVFEWVTALILEAEGDPAAARRSLAAAWDRLEPLRYVGTWPSVGTDLVRLHLAAGDRRNAADVTATTGLLLLEIVALVIGAIAGWLGGELVDRLGVGVDDGANLDAPSSLSGRPARSRS